MGRVVPIRVPTGAVRSGTEYETKGRWRDVNLVRWHERSMKPVGGWTSYTSLPEGFAATVFDGYSPTPSMGDPVGCIAWVSDAGTAYAIWCDNNNVISLSGSTFEDIEPGTYTGNQDWVQFSLWGQIPVMCAETDGRLNEWTSLTGAMTQITNSPTGNVGILVTDERFIFALQPRRVEWCDRNDRTTWTPAATNQAGGFDLDTDGTLLFALQMRGEVLIVGTRDCWSARYIGYPDVWEFRHIGRTSAVGGVCGVTIGDRAFWLGRDGFWSYSGGFISKVPCAVWDYIRTDIGANPDVQTSNVRKAFAWHNIAFDEVWWMYQAVGANQKDSYVAYNYTTGDWHYGEAPFGAVASTNSFDTPLGFTQPDVVDDGYDEDYASDPGYTLGTNWRIASNVLDQSTPTASSASYDLSIYPAGTVVWLTVVVANRTAGGFTVTFGSTTSSIAGNGTYVATLTTTLATQTLTITADGTWDGDITQLYITRSPVMEMETGNTHHYVTAPYAETGPIELGNGQRRVHVTRLLPDEQDAGELQFTFKTREYPTATETTHTAVTATNPTSVRFSGRQFKMRVEAATSGVDWRSGEHRLEVRQGGRR